MATITVIGGTGYAGSAVVKEARSRGHRVTSVSRNAPTDPVDGVTYLALPAAEAAQAIAGADVVVAALSPRGDNVGELPGTYRRLAAAAAEQGARFVVVGGFSSLRPAPGAPRFADGDDLPSEFAVEAREMNSILTELLAGALDVDWLFVSPAGKFGAYVPGAAVGHYRVGEDVVLLDEDGESAISGADFALALVDEIEVPTHHRAQIHFAY
ncbi:MAG: NAD(P)-dependent oxidoreductase [Cellulomonas sp.]